LLQIHIKFSLEPMCLLVHMYICSYVGEQSTNDNVLVECWQWGHLTHTYIPIDDDINMSHYKY